jgi:hypothetical protein
MAFHFRYRDPLSDGWRVTPPAAPRTEGMERDDPMARVREQRRKALISELVPKSRRFNPLWSDHEVLETAESMAELRLLDEEID